VNLPNVLTAFRLLAAGILLALFAHGGPWTATAACGVFIAAAISDWLDGYLARSSYGVTTLGQLLDPLADKVLVCAALVSFVEIRLPDADGPLLPAWIVVLILTREFLITGLRVLAMKAGRDISAGAWGKHKTFWQMGLILALLVALALWRDWLPRWGLEQVPLWSRRVVQGAYWMGLAVALLTVLSGVVYVRAHRDVWRA